MHFATLCTSQSHRSTHWLSSEGGHSPWNDQWVNSKMDGPNHPPLRNPKRTRVRSTLSRWMLNTSHSLASFCWCDFPTSRSISSIPWKFCRNPREMLLILPGQFLRSPNVDVVTAWDMFRRRKWQLITFNEIPHAVQLDSNFTSRRTRKRQDPTDGECRWWLCLYYRVRCETSCQNAVVGWNRPWLVSLQSTWTWFFRSMDLFFLINGRLEMPCSKKQGMWWDYHSFVTVYHFHHWYRKSQDSPGPGYHCRCRIPPGASRRYQSCVPLGHHLGTRYGTVFFHRVFINIIIYIYIYTCVCKVM